MLSQDSGCLHSLVIPTRNRQQTAEIVVRKALSLLPEDAEIVVQDCSSTPVLQVRLGDVLVDPRVRYHYSGDKPISMTDNWNLAIQHCRGKYLSFIGDDDGISLDFYDATRWIDANNLDAVICTAPSTQYYWPDYGQTEMAAACTVYEFSGQMETMQVAAQLQLTFKSITYAETLPKLYCGIVRKTLVDQIRLPDGRHFRGVTPDYYAVFRLACLAKEVTMVDYPLFLHGHCGKSNTSLYLEKKSWTNHILEYEHLDWPEILPRKGTRSMMVLMTEPLILGLMDGGKTPLLEANLDLATLYLLAIRADSSGALDNVRRFVAACRTLGRPVPVEMVKALAKAARFGAAALWRRLLRRPIRMMHNRDGVACTWLRGLDNIADAIDALHSRLGAVTVTPPWAAGPVGGSACR